MMDDQVRGERRLIERIGQRLAQPIAAALGAAPAVGFGDDMAPLPAPGGPLLWTTDMLMDGVDFDSRRHPWAIIGAKSLAVSLSDCAAMGVRPCAALCAVALSNSLTMDDAAALLDGAARLAERFGFPIVGGDTNSWDAPTVVAFSVAGAAPPGQSPVRRDGARAGDTLWVSGPLGGSILARHLTFEPRVELGVQIAARLSPTAMIDISDGLVIDLARVVDASGCGATLDADMLRAVVHADALNLERRGQGAGLEHALYDGEDFELLVALPAGRAAEAAAIGLLPIGVCDADAGIRLRRDGAVEPLPVRGWEHFR